MLTSAARAAQAQAAQEAEAAGESSGGEAGSGGESAGEAEGDEGGKKGRARRERREARAAEAAARDARETKRKLRNAKYEERERLREEAEREAEEKEAEREAEREKAAKEEFDQWKDMFSVDESGEAAAVSEEQRRDMLSEFVAYIQRRKMVVLEELAAHFDLPAAEAVARVQALEEQGRITGIFDDRGKFIYISEAELQAVADHIVAKGRVSIAELARASNELLDLEEREAEAVDEEAARAVAADMEDGAVAGEASTSA